MKRFTVVAFLLISIVHLAALLINISSIAFFTKPLIVLVLLAHYFISTTSKSWSMIFGLLFCWAGDTLLLFQPQHELFFIGGLLAFLVGHVFYMITYRQHQTTNTTKELLSTQKIRFSLPIILAGTGLIVILFPRLGDLKIPVLVYGVVLILMVMNALFRFGKTTDASFWMVFFGALLFQFSDSLLAINKFHSPILLSSFWVMITYISAQYLIVRGIIKHH
jgi:uncharacterized membrane protein YhhN